MTSFWIAIYSQADADSSIGRHFLSLSSPPTFKWSLFGEEANRVSFPSLEDAAYAVRSMVQPSQCLDYIDVQAHLAFDARQAFCPDAAYIGIIDKHTGTVIRSVDIERALTRVATIEENHAATMAGLFT